MASRLRPDQSDDPNSGGQKHGGYTSISDTRDQTYDYDDTSQAYGEEGDSGGPAIQAYTDCVVGVFGGTDPGFLSLDTDWELTRTDTKLGLDPAEGERSERVHVQPDRVRRWLLPVR